jgi:CIC family chloride channel protein
MRDRFGCRRHCHRIVQRLVAIVSRLSQIAHALLFDIPTTIHLSAATSISWQRVLFAAILG